MCCAAGVILEVLQVMQRTQGRTCPWLWTTALAWVEPVRLGVYDVGEFCGCLAGECWRPAVYADMGCATCLHSGFKLQGGCSTCLPSRVRDIVMPNANTYVLIPALVLVCAVPIFHRCGTSLSIRSQEGDRSSLLTRGWGPCRPLEPVLCLATLRLCQFRLCDVMSHQLSVGCQTGVVDVDCAEGYHVPAPLPFQPFLSRVLDVVSVLQSACSRHVAWSVCCVAVACETALMQMPSLCGSVQGCAPHSWFCRPAHFGDVGRSFGDALACMFVSEPMPYGVPGMIAGQAIVVLLDASGVEETFSGSVVQPICCVLLPKVAGLAGAVDASPMCVVACVVMARRCFEHARRDPTLLCPPISSAACPCADNSDGCRLLHFSGRCLWELGTWLMVSLCRREGRLPCTRRPLNCGAFLVGPILGHCFVPQPCLCGTRVGEASNPGPQADIRTFFAGGKSHVLDAGSNLERGAQQAAPSVPTPLRLSCHSARSRPSAAQPRAPGAEPESRADDGCLPQAVDPPPSGGSVAFRMAVINPTAVHGKEDAIAAMGAQLVFMSETSAVHEVQVRAQKAFKLKGFHSVWSSPVEPHLSKRTGEATLRGHALGVAVASTFPLHQSPTPLPVEAYATQRLVEGMLRVGCVQFRIIAVYGFPSCHSEAKQRNQQLFRMVLDRVALSRLPTVIGGDMNVCVRDLPVWEQFEHLGYREMFEFCATRFGSTLPPTCRNATRHDTLLIPPLLQELVQHATVDSQSKLFDAHDPLLVTCAMPPHETPLAWRMPQAWTAFAPAIEHAAAIYQHRHQDVAAVVADCLTVEDVSHAFQYWASAVEDSVDGAIRAAHEEDPVAQPHSHLPRAARGRCAYRERVPTAHPRVSPKARCGGYDPVCEAMTMSSRRKVKQVRRLHTLWQGCCALERRIATTGHCCPALLRQLRTEWSVVRKNKAFGPRFDVWLLGFESFGQVWVDVPPALWLADVVQLARHACDAQVRSEATVRKKRFQYLVQLDCAHGGQKHGFGQLRPKPRPVISCLPVTEVRDVVKVLDVNPSVALYEVHHPQFLRVHCPTFSSAGEAVVEEILPETQGERADWAKVKFLSVPPPERCRLMQKTQAVTCQELHREFVEYWSRIWWRDTRTESLSEESWPDFMALLPARPEVAETVQLALQDVSVWEAALRRLQPHKATGYDGFSPAELKGIQGQALRDLVALFQQVLRIGFPKHLARSRVHVLSKCECPTTFGDGRPITIYSATYRLWSGIVARTVLAAWAAWLPPGIAGSLPGRCSSGIAFEIQSRIEAAILDGEPLSGFSLDITKCFNNLPRPPVARLLKHLGMPPDVVDRWMQFLDVSERNPVFNGGMCAPIGASTGTPEGDALSVVAMCAVCWMLVQCNRATSSHLLTFVDNFTWLASRKDSLRASLRVAISVCSSLRLPIDWAKSFSWATTVPLRQYWDKEASRDLPDGVRLRRVREAMDLGVGFCFQSKMIKGKAEKRLEEGRRRLDVLRKQPRPLQSKLHLLLGAIWPQCFFGMHARVLPRATMDQFRSKAARALCHAGPSLSPYLVLSAVVPPLADPEVYMMIQSAVAMRKAFLLNPDLAMAILLRAVTHWHEGLAVGPATAFATMFQRQGWELAPTGWCTGPGLHAFSIKCSSRGQISRAIQAAWVYALDAKLEHRNGLHNVGALSVTDTVQVIRSLPQTCQRMAANCVAGGHMSACSRALWDPLVDGSCQFCGLPDTKYHRVYECPAFLEARIAYLPTLQWMQQHASHWIHAACVTEHPDAHVLRLIFRARPHVDPPKLIVAPQQGVRVMYTDGSCTVPFATAARHASWAVVEDVATQIPTECLLAYFQQKKQILQNFHVVAQGLVPCEQTIGRAEIVALLQVCILALREPHVSYHVHVDSAYALQFLDRLGLSRVTGKGPATDVDLCEWTGVWVKPNNVFCHKVRSHSDLHAAPVSVARHALGNAMADMAAKAARQRDAPFLYDILDAIDERQRIHQDMLRSYLAYQQTCAQIASAAIACDNKVDPEGVMPQGTEMEQLAEWDALVPASLMQLVYPELQTTWLEASPWPPWYTRALWEWCTELRWPAASDAPKQLAGVTLLELLADFMATTGFAPPVGSVAGAQASIPLMSAAGRVLPVSLKELVITLSAGIKYLESVSKTSLMLGVSYKRVPCLRVLGCHASRRGYIPRPQLASQGEAGRLVLAFLKSDNQAEVVRKHLKPFSEADHGYHTEVHGRWEALTEHQRVRLRSKLKR